jgi:hypothetical protein
VSPKETVKIRAGSRRADADSSEDLVLYYPILLECRLERTEVPTEQNSEKPERFYDSAIRPVNQTDESLGIGLCEFSAGLRLNEIKTLEISAEYFVGVKGGRPFGASERKNMLEQSAKSSAWPLFRDLFIHMGSQTGAELPLLPNIPKIRWLKPKQELSESKEQKRGK